jgi:HK97 family phage portal protein
VSQVAVALPSIDADTASTEYVRSFWNNGGAPSGILAISGRTLTDVEIKAIQQRFTATYGRNGPNRNGVAVMPDGTTYTQVGSKLNELNNESLDDSTIAKICSVFGVPPIIIGALVGLKHVTQNATSKAAMSEFWAHTMSPELKSIRNFLTWNLLPMFEPIEQIKAGLIRVNWDLSMVDALQEDLDNIAKRSSLIYQEGIATLDEARGMMKLKPVGPEKGGDAFYQKPAPVAGFGQEKPPKGFTGVWVPGQAIAGDPFKQDILDSDTIEKKTLN